MDFEIKFWNVTEIVNGGNGDSIPSYIYISIYYIYIIDRYIDCAKHKSFLVYIDK